MNTPVWFMLVLPVLSLNVTNSQILKKEISAIVISMFLNDGAGHWAASKVILPMRKKPFYATLNIASMFSLPPAMNWYLVSLRWIFLVIGMWSAFM